ncbi:MAG: hypothetical protein V4444_00825 [Pseudomonadota bacterium]
MMIILIGLVVGFLAGRLRWWLGLLILLLSAVILSGIATAVIIAHPEDYPFHMSVKSFVQTVVQQLPLLGPGYAVGWGARWLLERRRAKTVADFSAGRPPQPMRVWKYIWLRPLIFAAVPTLLIALRVLVEGSSNASSNLELAKRAAVVFLSFYAMFVAFAAVQWRSAKPLGKGPVAASDGSRE